MEDEPKSPILKYFLQHEQTIFVSKLIYVDVDGCICTTNYHTKDFRDIEASYINVEPFLDRIECINRLFDKGHHIVYWTARGSYSGIDYFEITKNQLDKWKCKYHKLSVGEKPAYDLLICDKTKRIEEI